MADKTVKWNRIKYKIWFQQKVARAKAKASAAGNWIKEHPMEAIAAAGAAAGVVHKVSNIYCSHAEDVRRRRDFYDPRTGRHAITRRDLNRREQEEVDTRYNCGESYTQIFSDMGLLK